MQLQPVINENRKPRSPFLSKHRNRLSRRRMRIADHEELSRTQARKKTAEQVEVTRDEEARKQKVLLSVSFFLLQSFFFEREKRKEANIFFSIQSSLSRSTSTEGEKDFANLRTHSLSNSACCGVSVAVASGRRTLQRHAGTRVNARRERRTEEPRAEKMRLGWVR